MARSRSSSCGDLALGDITFLLLKGVCLLCLLALGSTTLNVEVAVGSRNSKLEDHMAWYDGVSVRFGPKVAAAAGAGDKSGHCKKHI